ncbi:MAG: hypothetical protein J6A52_06470 [Bacilli bacterium]|nr:hypothetical protein [Bacilli bacterium]
MNEKVEHLIKQALINLSREKRLHKHIISKMLSHDEVGVDYLCELYKECSEKTALLIDEIFRISDFDDLKLTEYVLSCGYDLEEETGVSYSVSALLDVMKSQKMLCLPTSKFYAAKSSVYGEYAIIMHELKLKSLSDESKGSKEKDAILDELAEETVKEEVFRQLFRKNYELAEALCNPKLYYSDSFISHGLKKFGERSVRKLLERVSNPILSVLMNVLGKDPLLKDICCAPISDNAVLQIAATDILLRRYGNELTVPQDLLTDSTRPILEGAFDLTKRYYDDVQKKVIRR